MIIVATSVVVRIEQWCTGGAEPECPTRSARSADVNCFCCWWTQSGALCSKPPAEGQRRRRGKNPQPGGLSQRVFQEALQGLTPSTACTLSVPSLKNWKRGCLSYLPILSERRLVAEPRLELGISWLPGGGVFVPFLLPRETLQKKWPRQSVCTAPHASESTLLLALEGLECWVAAALAKQAFGRTQ